MARPKPCPRCGGQLIGWQDADTSCLQCGYVAHVRSPWSAKLIGKDIDLERADETGPSREREPQSSE